MYNIIPFIAIIASLAVILFIVVRKFPTLRSIDTEALSSEKQSKLHEKIVIDRIKRRLSGLGKIGKMPVVGKVFNTTNNKIKKVYHRLLDLEKKHRFINSKKVKEVREKVLSSGSIGRYGKEERTLNEANMLLSENELESAEKKFIDVIGMNSENIEAYEGLGEVYINLNQNDSARETFEHITKLDVDNSNAFYKLGNISFSEGDVDTARENYIKANNLKKHDVLILTALSDSCQELEYNEEAVSYLKEIINLEPNNPRYLDSLISISIKIKDKGLAESSLGKLKDVNPENKKIKGYEDKIKLL